LPGELSAFGEEKKIDNLIMCFLMFSFSTDTDAVLHVKARSAVVCFAGSKTCRANKFGKIQSKSNVIQAFYV
jgi:hypothetical protein